MLNSLRSNIVNRKSYSFWKTNKDEINHLVGRVFFLLRHFALYLPIKMEEKKCNGNGARAFFFSINPLNATHFFGRGRDAFT